MTAYIGRFAPSPTGPLHSGSIVAALASYLDARAHGGQWLLRIEDLDPPRQVPGATPEILRTLQALHLRWDGDPMYQSTRTDAYEAALMRLRALRLAYPCTCSRKEIADSRQTQGERAGLAYPGTCRLGPARHRAECAWRFQVDENRVCFSDRWIGEYAQDVAREVGDFIVRRADGLYAYQLAVVVDDAAQGVTHVVRGEDLLDSTPRQLALQQALGYAQPSYLHVPVVRAADGRKLSKQTGAAPVDTQRPQDTLERAWLALGFAPFASHSTDAFLEKATACWAQRFKTV